MNHPLTQAFLDLFKQGACGYGKASANSNLNRCLYATMAGNSCVVGLMLKPHMTYDELKLLGGSVLDLLGTSYVPEAQKAKDLLLATKIPAALLQRAQVLHDAYAKTLGNEPFDPAGILAMASGLEYAEILPYVQEAYNLYKEQA